MVFIVINPKALSGSTDGSVKLWCLKDTTFRCSGISNCNVTASCWVDWVAMADGRFFGGPFGKSLGTLWPYYGHTIWHTNGSHEMFQTWSDRLRWILLLWTGLGRGTSHRSVLPRHVVQQLSQLSQFSPAVTGPTLVCATEWCALGT